MITIVLVNRWRWSLLTLLSLFLVLHVTQACAFELTAPGNYSKDFLTTGSVYYLDRDFTITNQPAEFDGYQAILTRNDDKDVSASLHIQFTLTAVSDVYAGYDQRATSTPDWLDNSWTKTALSVETSDASMGHFEVYRKEFSAGTVTLGGNVEGGATGADSMYIVYVDEVVPLTVAPATIEVAFGDVLMNAVKVSGGELPYTVVSSDASITDAVIAGNQLQIAGVGPGSATLTITDGAGTDVAVAVTVTNDIVANPNPLNWPVGKVDSIALGGGVSPYTLSIGNSSLVSAVLDVDTIAVVALASGSTTLRINDSAGGSLEIPVKVYPPLTVNLSVVNLLEGATSSVTVSGGAGSYTVFSNNTLIAAASISGSTLTVSGNELGSTTVTVTDADNNRVVVGVVVGVPAGAGLLASCPAPPFVGGGSVAPNIMLILDHSGSMGSGAGSRWDVAKQVLISIVDQFPGIRFGLMRMDGSNYSGDDQIGNEAVVRQGGKILRPVGSSHDSIKTYINNWGDNSNTPQTWTVLAEVLASAGQYFATAMENGNRIGNGPPSLGYYQKNYTYDIASTTYDATTTDDKGNSIDTFSPIQFYCQKSFVILVTDGESNFDNDWPVVTLGIGDYDNDSEANDCTNGAAGCPADGRTTYLDDVAQFLYESDMRTDLSGTRVEDDIQNITTYVVGFHANFPLLEQAANQGGGKYYTATDYTGLLTSLQNAIQDILFKTSSGTSVATVSTSSSSQDHLLRAKFVPGEWQGSLEAFSLPYSATDAPIWSAAALLNVRSAATRNIFTSISTEDPKRQDFLATNTTVSDLLKGAGYWNVSDAEAADIINYVRGDQTYDGGKYRDRKGWLLGDIIHSTPVSVGPPKFYYTENGYLSYRSSQSSRPHLVYVGANDGMLHAFYAFDDPSATPAWVAGKEAWTFIPENVQKNLKDLTADCHQYFVDLNPLVADVWDSVWDVSADDHLTGAGVIIDGWKTVLIGGNRLGGEGYFALDVSDPADYNNVNVLWDKIPFPDSVRKSSNLPVVGKMQPVDKWLTVITSGYHEGVATGRIAALDMASGDKQLIWNDGTSDVNELPTQAKSGYPYYTLSAPVAFDSTDDGYFDLIYAGDTEGTLWKFYFDYVDNIWKQVALFNTGGTPITGRPTLAPDANGWLRIYFGTGTYLVDLDKIDTARNAFYSIIEKPVSTGDANNGHFTGISPLVLNDLQDMTAVMNLTDFAALTVAEQAAVKNVGWYILLDDPQGLPGERVIGIPLVFAGSVLFTSFTPNEDACGAGGVSKLYAIDFLYGYQAIVNSSETVLRSSFGGNIPAGDRSVELGAGLASDPVLYFNRDTGESTLIVQTSDTTVHEKKVNLGVKPMALRSWREVDN